MNSFRSIPAPSADSWRMVWSAIPASSASVTRTRIELASWLNEHFALSEERRVDVVLAVDEALANAVEAVAADEPVIELIATHDLDDATLTVTVANPGGWRSPEWKKGPEPSVHRGHGIRLMQASADHVCIDLTAAGTAVMLTWTEIRRSARLHDDDHSGRSPLTRRAVYCLSTPRSLH